MGTISPKRMSAFNATKKNRKGTAEKTDRSFGPRWFPRSTPLVLVLLSIVSWAHAQRFTYELGLWLEGEGEGAVVMVKDKNWEDFSTQKRALNARGFQLFDLESYVLEEGRRYGGIFRPGRGNNPVLRHATWSHFNKYRKRKRDRGLHLVDLLVTKRHGRTLFSGVWVAGAKEQHIARDLDRTALRRQQTIMARRRMYLVDLETYRVGRKRHFAAVWQRGGEPVELVIGLLWNPFHGKYHELGNRGKRLVDLEAYEVDGKTRYLGIWRAGHGQDYLHFGPSVSKNAAGEAGLVSARLIDMEYVRESTETESGHPELNQEAFKLKDPRSRDGQVQVVGDGGVAIERDAGAGTLDPRRPGSLVLDGGGIPSGRPPIHEGGSVGPGT